MADNEKGKKPENKQNPKSIAAFGRKVAKFVKDCRPRSRTRASCW